MESREIKNKIKCSMQEIIALSNFKEEIATQALKRKIICQVALPICAIFILGGFIIVNNNYNSLKVKEAEGGKIGDYTAENFLSNNKIDSERICIAKIIEETSQEKIFYENAPTSEELSFEYAPTIENLYEYADIVLIGKYNSYEKIYTDDINIYTTTKFDVIKTIKNTTEFDISKEVVFERNGGALTLDRFTKSSQAIRAGKSKDIEEDIKDYYVIQEYDPENMLDFESKKNSGDIYIIFLKQQGKTKKILCWINYFCLLICFDFQIILRMMWRFLLLNEIRGMFSSSISTIGIKWEKWFRIQRRCTNFVDFIVHYGKWNNHVRISRFIG